MKWNYKMKGPVSVQRKAGGGDWGERHLYQCREAPAALRRREKGKDRKVAVWKQGNYIYSAASCEKKAAKQLRNELERDSEGEEVD